MKNVLVPTDFFGGVLGGSLGSRLPYLLVCLTSGSLSYEKGAGGEAHEAPIKGQPLLFLTAPETLTQSLPGAAA